MARFTNPLAMRLAQPTGMVGPSRLAVGPIKQPGFNNAGPIKRGAKGVPSRIPSRAPSKGTPMPMGGPLNRIR